jgi:serine/threonine protein phosphatase 1
MPAPYPPVLCLGRGLGRDFVMGDVHGAFDLVDIALRRVAFDPAVDRLFSVGDLVDRGPYSVRALEYLAQDWFYAVRGNHEQLLLDCHAGGVCNEGMLAYNVEKNGQGWWLTTPQSQRDQLLAAFARLPLVIDIETADGRVGLVHADVPPGLDWDRFKTLLNAGNSGARHYALWSRERSDNQDMSGVAGVGRVYVGHTPLLGGVRCLGNVWMIDTAAVFARLGRTDRGELSVLELDLPQRDLRHPERASMVATYRAQPHGLKNWLRRWGS